MSKSRNWCFTLNNPDEVVYDEDKFQNVKLLVAGLETGESGTVHYQGYVELKTPRALSALKVLFPTAHWEVRRGNRLQAVTYCLKEYVDDQGGIPPAAVRELGPFYPTVNGPPGLPPGGPLRTAGLDKVIIFGHEGSIEDLLKPEKKRKVEEQMQEIQAKLDNGIGEDVISSEHFSVWCKYRQSFKHYKTVHQSNRTWKSNVIVVQGPTGSGKSKWALESYPGAFWKDIGKWWDKYEGQETVIIDEFYGWIPYGVLLRMCDRYPMQVEIKGGATSFLAKTIIIISNKRPDLWYPNQYFDALMRRVDEWRVVGLDSTNVYTNYQDVEWIEC